jgi:plasmid maintenance system antidote protein VapI
MPFNNQTRNRLARLVSDARNLLTDEFTKQLQEVFGIQPDGTIVPLEKLTHLSDEQTSEASVLRDRVTHLASGLMAEKKPAPFLTASQR